MKRLAIFLSAVCFFVISFSASATVQLNVKIGRVVGKKTIETVKTYSVNYNQDIIIPQEDQKSSIVIRLKKFQNILVNGSEINPVQIDMKVLNEIQEVVGVPQTVTSFYKKSAEFKGPGLNVALDFEENN